MHLRRLPPLLACASILALGVSAAVAPPAQASTSPEVSVIVRAAPGHVEAAVEDVRRAGGRIGRRIGVINGFTARIPTGAADAIAHTKDVASLTTDAGVKLLGSSYDAHHDGASLFNLEDIIGARGMWNKYTGAGIDVALLDSGVAPVTGLDSPGQVLHGPDLTQESQNEATQYTDTFGHGTAMASIIAGHDPGVAPAQNQGNAVAFMGVAPDARIVSVKVADSHGETDVSQVLAGIDWVVQHAHDPGMNIRVLNLSFGSQSSQGYGTDPLAYAAEQAWKHGIVVVVSAGNTGSSDGHLTDPAIDPYVIAVGADNVNGSPSTDDDTVASFSARGDGIRNPDILAPGLHVQSLRAPGSYIDQTYASTGAINDRYFRGSGTSQAAAVISGAASLLVQEHPSFTPDQIKALLTTTASPLKNVPTSAQGAGLLNLRNAMGPVHSTLPAQSFPASTGLGTLDASRGAEHLTSDGVVLGGEEDIFGQSVNTASLAAAEAGGTAWTGGSWNGSSWSGSSWSGSSWSGSSWSGSSWSGSSWSGSSWSGSSWSGSSWSGRAWSAGSWADSQWATGFWS